MLSIVIPVLNAAAALPGALRGALPGALPDAPAASATADEFIVVDGGSSDGSRAIAASLGARVLTAPRGRGSQMAAGVAAASGDWLLLLHADTRMVPGWRDVMEAHMATQRH